MRHVAMIHFGRVGSTILADQLRQHSAVWSDGEILNENVNPFLVNGKRHWWTVFDSEQSLFDKTRYRNPVVRSGKPIYLFEYKPFLSRLQDLSPPSILPRVAAFGAERLIYLERRNLLRRFISLSVSVKTGVWHTRQPLERPERVRIDCRSVFDPDFVCRGLPLVDYLDRAADLQRRYVEAVSAAGGLVLTYEDTALRDPRLGYQAVCAFLGVEPEPADIRFVRQNTGRLCDIVENHEEVREALAGTRHEPMLADEPG